MGFNSGFKGLIVGGDSVGGIATRYGLEGRGSNPGGGDIFRTRPDRPQGPPSLLYNEYKIIPAGKVAEAWRRPLTPIYGRG